MEKDYGYLFNIIMIGDSGVGKTSILMQYKDGKFAYTGIPTLGIDFCIKTHEIDGNDIKLQVWDTGGQEIYHAVTRSYYHKADAVVLVYDISCADTFHHLPFWLGEVKKHAKEDVYCLLVGNKSDLRDKKKRRKEERKGRKESGQERKVLEESGKEERKGMMESETEENMVTKESGKQFADENSMPFLESTATDWDNIYELFAQLAKTLLDKKLIPASDTPHEEASDTQEMGTVDLVYGDKNQKKHGRKCCGKVKH